MNKRLPISKIIIFLFLLNSTLFIVLIFPNIKSFAYSLSDKYKDSNSNFVGPIIESQIIQLNYISDNNEELSKETRSVANIYQVDISQFKKIFNGYNYIDTINNLNTENKLTYQYHKITPIEIINNDDTPLGNYGRFYCLDANISVAINFCSSDDNLEQEQNYVDMQDSACMCPYGIEYFLCDHYAQGFNKILNIKNNTLCYIKRVDGTIETWKCVYGGNGTNGVYDSLNFNGLSVGQQNSGGICLYTCQGDDSYNVHMKFLQKI